MAFLQGYLNIAGFFWTALIAWEGLRERRTWMFRRDFETMLWKSFQPQNDFNKQLRLDLLVQSTLFPFDQVYGVSANANDFYELKGGRYMM